jgi:hypothetical protein
MGVRWLAGNGNLRGLPDRDCRRDGRSLWVADQRGHDERCEPGEHRRQRADDIISRPGPKVTYSYQVRVYDSFGTLLRASEWMSVTYSHA